jgi:muconate cycloisomerase
MVAKIDTIPLRLPLLRELKISRGSVGSPSSGAIHILVKVTDENGIDGWGEARPSPRWPYETPESVFTTINRYIAPSILGMDEFDLAQIHRMMDSVIAPGVQIGQPIAKSAIDIALHDLIGRKLGISIQTMLGSRSPSEIRLGYIVSADTIDEALKQTQEGLDKGFIGFKVKAGIHPEKDLDMVRQISPLVRQNGDCFLWVDANQGWHLKSAIRYGMEMAKLGVDAIEQPLPSNNITGYRELVSRSEVPVVLDESIYSTRSLSE